MAVEASGEPNLLCGSDFGDDGRVTLKQHSEGRKFASDEGPNDCDDDRPLSASLFQNSSSNFDISIKKMPTTLTVKRPLDNINSLHNSVKKSKVSSYDVDVDVDDDDDNMPISWIVKKSAVSADKPFSMMKKFMVKELDLLEETFEECQRKTQVKEQRLLSLDRDIEECTIELENKKKQVGCIRKINQIYKKLRTKIEESVYHFVTNETLNSLMEDLIRERKLELKTKEIELHQVMDNISKERERKEEELEVLFQKTAQCTKELKTKEEKFDAIKTLYDGQAKELESERKKLLKVISTKNVHCAQMKDFESMKKQHESRIKELESLEEQLEGRVNELELKEKKLKGQIKEFESKEEYFVEQVKDLESRKEHCESLMEELKSKEKQLECRAEELELKEKQFQDQVNEVQSKEGEFVEQVNDLESIKKHFESQMEEIKSKEKKLEGRLKQLESKENQLEDRVKEFELKIEEFESQVKESKSDERREKKQYEVLVKSFKEENELDNQLSPSIDGRSLQLLPSEKAGELESLEDDILGHLKATSDPSKVVLDIIQKPIIPPCTKGDNTVIVDSSHIYILEQLMRISPHVKPQVREEAMRLALDLKASMRANTENSLVVLCFLLILSIYGLLPYFDEDEVLKLFEFTALHKLAVELFRTLGFSDKVSDFVQSLIKKQQYIEAVRFICAFKLADMNRPVDLLREYVNNAKLITETSCRNTNSLEIMDKARDQEIATLKSVLQCASDNNLESEVLLNEIEDRIVELDLKKGTGVYFLRKRNLVKKTC